MKNFQKNLYHQLLYIRRVQEEISNRYHPADNMKCPMHFCMGQEIGPAALSSFLRPRDAILSHHRSHGYFLANKGSLNEMIAEFHGKETGTNGGLAGSQELSCTKTHFYSGTILSGAFGMSLGDAFSKVYKNENNITISVIGDGGMEEGICSETLNMAILYKLPILFICENNKYSTHTKLNERTEYQNVSERIKGYKIESHLFNSNDPEKLYMLLKNLTSKIRKTKKPIFLEIMTYRFNGHVGPEGDDHYNYRSKAERDLWSKKDPLKVYRKKLDKKFGVKFKNFENKILNNINKKIDHSFAFALKSSFAKAYKKYNYQNTYHKSVKKFFNNDISFNKDQDDHRPMPY